MTDLPRHRDASDEPAPQGGRSSAHRPWWAFALGAVVVVALVLMVVLHLTGTIGPGSH